MTREEYIKRLLEHYLIVSVLSEKNGCKVIRIRNRQKNTDLVLRSFSVPVPAYDELYKIKNENLPIIYDTVTLSDGQIVLEEYIDGITVAQIMETGKYRYMGARKIIKSVCSALTIIHNLGITHRDIKPENVMISKNGRVVLIDFNASNKMSKAKRDTVVMGTVGYASPEQLGISRSDARTDIYALGVMLNVMLTGKHPSELIAKGKAGRIVRKSTSINPDERYQTAERLAKAL